MNGLEDGRKEADAKHVFAGLAHHGDGEAAVQPREQPLLLTNLGQRLDPRVEGRHQV